MSIDLDNYNISLKINLLKLGRRVNEHFLYNTNLSKKAYEKMVQKELGLK